VIKNTFETSFQECFLEKDFEYWNSTFPVCSLSGHTLIISAFLSAVQAQLPFTWFLPGYLLAKASLGFTTDINSQADQSAIFITVYHFTVISIYLAPHR